MTSRCVVAALIALSMTACGRGGAQGSAGAPTAPEGPPAGGGPPPASADVFRDDFESGAPLGSGQGPSDPRWGDICCGGGAFTVVAASSAGIPAFSGSRVLRVGNPGGALTHWIKSVPGGTSLQPRTRLHLSLRLYVPASWTGVIRFMTVRGSRDPWGSFGIGGVCPATRPPQSEFVSASVNANPVRMYTYWLGMDPQSGQPWSCTGTNGLFAGDAPPATYHTTSLNLPRDTWVHVELELQLNDVGQANGSQRIRVDGALVVEHTGVTYRRDAATLLQAITIDSGAISGSNMFYVDDVVARTAPP